MFGQTKEPYVLVLARGDDVRHMTIRPWMTALAIGIISLFSVGYLSATAYLVLRDDLIGASMARQARMQSEYEDRITALRAQVDRITSRQLLDQQVVEDKVEKLLEQQMALTNRQGKLGTVLERAENSGLDTSVTPEPAEIDAIKPEDHASLSPISAFDTLLGKKVATNETTSPKTRALGYMPTDGNIADRADRLFSKVTLSLKEIERRQLAHLQSLTADAAERSDKIGRILKNTGVAVPDRIPVDENAVNDGSDIGGPFVEPETAAEFESTITGLDVALDRLESMTRFARKLPFGNPAPGKTITSTFGNRLDPFFKRLAMHAGIDFRQRIGTPIMAPGAGTVIAAGPAGGYGIMVEIDHGNGITTRFGHLSKILVRKGDRVEEGEDIALSGSTGRSTGPHLHYEVRRNGQAVDPMRFLNAGMKLESIIR
jgi:murein DD-endopeptidase MepM/ murein hydrolase activator NlpD